MNHSKWNVKLKIIWNYFLACLIAIIVMIPFLWMLSTSLKSKGALMQIPIEWIPQNPTLDSYRMVFSRFPFLRAILNSFFITCSYTVVTILSASMAAFAFTKIQFPYGNAVFKLYLASMMIPTQVTMIPQTYVELTDEQDLYNINKILSLLDEDDDVQEVYHNWDE
mgnify:CR=1 FL=1